MPQIRVRVKDSLFEGVVVTSDDLVMDWPLEPRLMDDHFMCGALMVVGGPLSGKMVRVVRSWHTGALLLDESVPLRRGDTVLVATL